LEAEQPRLESNESLVVLAGATTREEVAEASSEEVEVERRPVEVDRPRW
jgi:hypothetical protein